MILRIATIWLLLLSVASAKDYTAADLGLWLNNTAEAARKTNDERLAQFLTGKQPERVRLRTPTVEAGDTLTWSGVLAIHEAIEFPTRTGLGGGDNQKISRPMSFAIHGDGASTALDCDGQIAVRVVDNWPLPPLAEYNMLNQRISGLTIKCPNGTGLDVYGGGKYLRVDDVLFVNCRRAANFAYYDGGFLDLHAHRCRSGVFFDACHMMQLRLTAREIGDSERQRYGMPVDDDPPEHEGVGLVMRNCTGNDCWLYIEALKLAADIDGSAESNFHLWTEHVGGLHSVHSWMLKLRNCQVNTWTGKTGFESGTPWDCDAVSWAMQRIIGEQPPVGSEIVSGDKVRLQIWGKFPKPVTVDDKGWVTIEPGALASGSGGYVAFTYPGEQQQTYKAGDVVQCQFDVEPDEATLKHWRSLLDTGGGQVPLRVSFANDLGAFWANSVFVHQPKQTVSFTRIAPADGTRILPMASLGLGYTSGPDETLRFRIINVRIRKLAGG